MIDGLTVRVAARHDEAADICSFELVRADGRSLPRSRPAHISMWPFPAARRASTRCAMHPTRTIDTGLPFCAIRTRAVGRPACTKVGDTLAISVPKNHFPLVHDAKHSLLLAGGIGVTPILCMAERLARVDASFDMHYCTRSRTRTAFLGHISRAPYAGRVQLHFDDEAAEQRFDIAARLAAPEPGTHLYVRTQRLHGRSADERACERMAASATALRVFRGRSAADGTGWAVRSPDREFGPGDRR